MHGPNPLYILAHADFFFFFWPFFILEKQALWINSPINSWCERKLDGKGQVMFNSLTWNRKCLTFINHKTTLIFLFLQCLFQNSALAVPKCAFSGIHGQIQWTKKVHPCWIQWTKKCCTFFVHFCQNWNIQVCDTFVIVNCEFVNVIP